MAVKYICSWCSKDDFQSYKDYVDHEAMHFNLDFINGIQRTYVCSFCPWGKFMEYELYRRHESAHEDIRSISDVEQPPPKRARYFFASANTFETKKLPPESPTPCYSPIAGPSNVQSPIAANQAEVFQSGEGEDEPFDYELVKLNQRTFRNSVIDTHYEVKFNVNAEDKKISDLYKKLEDMFDDIIDKASVGLQQSDLGRIIIHHNDLSNPIVVSLRPLGKLNGHNVMEEVQNVLNSHENLSLNDSFRVDMGVLDLPKGGRGQSITSLSGTNNSVINKRSIIEIRNDDDTCMSRAIIMAFLSANKTNQKHWQKLIENENDPNVSTEELILKYKTCPSWYFKKLRSPNHCEHRLNDLNSLLLTKVKRGGEALFTLNDIQVFEEYLNIDILVVSAKMGNKFLRVPPENSQKQRIYLYFIDDSHFHAISNIQGFFGSSKFCEKCLKPYQGRHQCEMSCFVCNTKGCHDDDQEKSGFVSCIKCHMTCNSLACFNRHLETRPRKNGDHISSCMLYWKCIICRKVISTEKRKPKHHKCGEYLCPNCDEYVDSTHLCYIRSLEPKPHMSKYIFFDFECSQADVQMTCKQGYVSQRVPDCEACKNQLSPCQVCVRCVNCKQSSCGKYQHTPNLVVAQAVCEHCIQDDCTPDSKCHTCGTRCSKCNAYSKKEKCYEKPPCEDTCGFKETVFKGKDTGKRFCQWLFDITHKGFTVMAHNSKSYDSYFVLDYLINNSIRPENIIYAGSKIMSMTIGRGLNIRIIDSVNFLPMKLSQLPDAFMLKELTKGYFPHFFNKEANQNYVGEYPGVDYYGCNAMNSKEREQFLTWHKEKLEKGEVFDFAKEIIEYCRSDVDILRRACLTFRDILLKITGGNEQLTGLDTGATTMGGVDPFNEITIAGVCSKVYKTKFLKENWEVKLRKDANVTDWLPAEKKDGKLSVYVNDRWIDQEDLQRDEYLIDASRFVNSPIAQVPSCGYVALDQYSMDSIKWLEWCMHKSKNSLKPLYIHHALNGGEVIVPGSNYKADGYSGALDIQKRAQKGGTIYEYLGCFWHGCPKCYPDHRHEIKLQRTKQSLAELYALTLKKEIYIKSQGIRYECIWEHEFKDLLEKNIDIRQYVDNLDLQSRLDPRDSFFGGRTNATKLQYKVKEGEKMHYVDFTSLYPYVNKYARYPIKHPNIITQDFKTIDQYFGIAKVKILPPRGLYHPVLPQKINEKLTFALCRTCAENQNQKACICSDEDRVMVGTWCTPELIKAVELGYKILKIYEVYHFDETSQYDPTTGTGGLFGEYINLFLKIKQESSDWPSWVKTEEDAALYIERYFQKEGIRLNPNNIVKNKALRSLAKLLLNSFWGKWGQRLNMPQTMFFHDYEADKFFRCLSDRSKKVKDFHIVTDDTIQITWESEDNFVKESVQTNIFIATMTTCWARLKLYSVLEMLGERVAYYDTDSVIFISRPGDTDPDLGDYLGELTNELDDGDHIIHFVSGGPKQYSYQTAMGKQVCKIRGFTLNYTNSKLLNFESLLGLIKTSETDKIMNDRKRKRDSDSIVVVNESKITRNKNRRKIYSSTEEKRYQIVYSKRAIQWDSHDTLPYGY